MFADFVFISLFIHLVIDVLRRGQAYFTSAMAASIVAGRKQQSSAPGKTTTMRRLLKKVPTYVEDDSSMSWA